MDSKRKLLYHAIIRYKQEHDGCAPSIRWLCDDTGIKSTSIAAYRLARLERDGLIRMSAGQKRSIEVVGGCWMSPDLTTGS